MRSRAKNYSPGQKESHRLSRSKIELYTQCPRCFWLEVRHGIKRPSGPPFRINTLVDELFKKEFDIYRSKKQPHPLMTKAKVEAIPFTHVDLDKWRANFTGVSTLHQPTNLHLFGAVDDVWVDKQDRLIVVDYKATAKNEAVKKLYEEGTWHDMYRRQMEIYQWLLSQNGFKVSPTGYFVYATGVWDKDIFDNTIEFETHVFPHHGNFDWVDKTIAEMKQCMDADEIPPVGKAAMGGDCEFCGYAKGRTELTLNHLSSSKK